MIVKYAHALALEQLNVQSQLGQVLYAEIKFSHAHPDLAVEVEVANADALDLFNLNQESNEHLMFFIRRQAYASHGVIVVSSSSPIYRQSLNVVLLVRHGNSQRLQQLSVQLPTATSTQSTISTNYNERLDKTP